MIVGKITKSVGQVFTNHILPDVLYLGGFVAITWGVHYWSIPSAWVVGGVLATLNGYMLGSKGA